MMSRLRTSGSAGAPMPIRRQIGMGKGGIRALYPPLNGMESHSERSMLTERAMVIEKLKRRTLASIARISFEPGQVYGFNDDAA